MDNVYEYKEKTYTVLYPALLKDGRSGVWNKALVYKSLETGLVYCRDRDDFESKFKKIYPTEKKAMGELKAGEE